MLYQFLSELLELGLIGQNFFLPSLKFDGGCQTFQWVSRLGDPEALEKLQEFDGSGITPLDSGFVVARDVIIQSTSVLCLLQ